MPISKAHLFGRDEIRAAEVALQIQGKAGERQVPDVNLGVSTGFGGCLWTDTMAYGKKKPA